MREQQKAVLDFIAKTIEERGYPPSLDEIADALGVSHRSTAHYHTAALVKDGLLEARPFHGTTAYFPTDLDSGKCDARWLAAIVDGEGSIVVTRRNISETARVYRAQITVGNTSRPLLEEVHRIAAVGSVNPKENNGLGKRPLFTWSASNRRAGAVLRRVYPFLIVKKQQARLAIYASDLPYHRGAQKRRTPEEDALLERCYETSKALNAAAAVDLNWVPEPQEAAA